MNFVKESSWYHRLGSKYNIFKQIFDLYTNEGYGTSKIARYLNNKDVLTRHGVKRK